MIGYYVTALKKFATLSGRARRSEYWYYTLCNLLIACGVAAVSVAAKAPLLYTVYALATLIPSFAVAVRRAHDTNKSGWFLIIPIYGFVLTLLPGTEGPNKYGDDPTESNLQPPFQQTLPAPASSIRKAA